MTSSWRARVPPMQARRPDGEREESRRQTLAAAPADELWVFTYGSLMWNPCFAAAESRRAVLAGYHRRFNFWTMIARGTPERPGLGLGLEPLAGAECVGLAYRLSDEPARREEDTQALWRREMHGVIYKPTWVTVALSDREVDALTFVLDPSQPQYTGALSADERAEIIAGASGKYGTCHDYLANTVAHLHDLGIREPELDDLLARVEAVLAGAAAGGAAGGEAR